MNFIEVLKRSSNPTDDCIRYALLWVASIDGGADEKERAYVVQNLDPVPSELSIDQLIDALNLRSPAIDSFVFTALRKLLSKSDRLLVLELAVGVARADGRVAHSEIHALRFVADALDISPVEFGQAYRREANDELPHAADLSDPSFWERAEQAAQERKSRQQGKPGFDNAGNWNWRWTAPGDSKGDSATRESLAILGLTDGATIQDIKDAYRRLAAVHHPDRFAAMGGAASEVASRTFQRIKAAYDHLCAQRQI